MTFPASRDPAAHSVSQATPDVCIVGGGLLGLSAAVELARAGTTVMVIERGDVGREASTANAGTMAIQNKNLSAVPAALLSLERWSELHDEFGADVGFDQRGGLCIAHDEDDLARLQAQVESQKKLGVPLELLRGDDVATIAPYVDESAIAAAYCPLDSMSDPIRAVAAFAAHARALGTQIVTREAVIDIQPLAAGSWSVRTPHRRVTAGAVVLATGAWTAHVGHSLGMKIGVENVIQTVSITESGPFYIPHIITHVQRNLTIKQSRGSGQILIGGGWRGRGDLGSDTKLVDPDTLSANLRRAKQTIRGIHSRRILRAWCGFEGRSPDRVPLLGSLPGHDSAYVVACAEGGYTLAPYLGRELASWLLHGPPADGSLAAGFDVKRFARAHAHV